MARTGMMRVKIRNIVTVRGAGISLNTKSSSNKQWNVAEELE